MVPGFFIGVSFRFVSQGADMSGAENIRAEQNESADPVEKIIKPPTDTGHVGGEPMKDIDVDRLAQILTISVRRVQQLVGEGVIIKSGRGRYDLVGSVQGYVQYLSDLIPNKQADGATREARINAEQQRAELLKERTKLARLHRKEKEGLLVDKEQERREAFKLARALRNGILNIPARVAAKYAGEKDTEKVFLSLQKELSKALELTADYAENEYDEHGFIASGGEDCPHWCGR